MGCLPVRASARETLAHSRWSLKFAQNQVIIVVTQCKISSGERVSFSHLAWSLHVFFPRRFLFTSSKKHQWE